MELQGKIILDIPLTSGVSKAGNPWQKKEWVMETFGQYPKKVKFHVFGEERIARNPFEIGKDYSVSFDLESREFNGRWYTDVNVYASQPYNPAQGFGQPAQGFGQATQGFGQATQGFGQPDESAAGEPAPAFGSTDQSDDLPF